MDALLIIAIIILAADIVSNIFYLWFGRYVVDEWKQKMLAAQHRAQTFAEILRKIGEDDTPPDIM